MNVRRIRQGRSQEVLVLKCVALGPVNQGGVVEHLLSRDPVYQHAEIETPEISVGVESKGVLRVRITQDHKIIASDSGRGNLTSQHAARLVSGGVAGDCVVVEQLQPGGVYTGEHRSDN